MKTRQDVMNWAEHEKTLDAKKIESMRIAVAALIFNAQGKILLHCRGPVAMDAVDCLEGIGGSLLEEKGEESLETALKRELAEEVANRSEGNSPCDFSVDEFLVCSHLPFENRQGEWKDWAVVTFLCRLLAGEPGIGEEGKTIGIGWFDLDELASWNPDQRRLVSLVDHNGNPFEREVGLSIWVPTAIQEYVRKYGMKPWRTSET